MNKFDVVVVGAGPAGSTAAYLLAKAGLKVLLLERGRGAGSKLLWGGKAYAQPLRDVWPELDKEAPIHRWVTKERISVLWGERAITLEYKLGRRVAFTSPLTELAAWMARKAEAAGALFLDEVVVEEIVVKDGRVVGVRSGGDFVAADVVIDAEGANRLLLEKLGLADRPNPYHMAVAAKEVISLDPRLIEERFGLERDEGLSWLVLGDVTLGIPGGGFVYTMRDTISIGIVLNVGYGAEAAEKGVLRDHISRLLENFRTHPYFRHYWKEADVIEYGGRMTVEGGLRFAPKRLYANGLLVVGDAAGMLVNAGYTIRGVDTAVTSARVAAEAVLEARDKGGFTEENLRGYEERLRKSYVYKELVDHSGVAEIFGDPFFFSKVPPFLVRAASKVFEADYAEPTLLEALKTSAQEEEINMLRLMLKVGRVVRRI
ncbi:MAG: FAD-dependent oxidoreductase [Acidilobaceae archaeon]|nr:FAD-dependent oxidoreductase [Acidilobaceae archaeon]